MKNMELVPCPCCGYLMFFKEQFPGSFDICQICFWEDDNLQYKDHKLAGGANEISLSQAQENFKKFGACEERFKGNIRPPKPEEIPDDMKDKKD